MYKRLEIQPLCGGWGIGNSQAFGQTGPDVILSTKMTNDNDQLYIDYLNSKNHKFNFIQKDFFKDFSVQEYKNQFDVINALPLCSGLSTISSSGSADSQVNENMFQITELALQIYPKIYVFENSPELANSRGRKISKRLYELAQMYGYSMLYFRTASMFHKLPQTRERTFALFFRKDVFLEIPLLQSDNNEFVTFEDFMHNLKPQSDDTMWNISMSETKPSDAGYYKMISKYENINSYREFVEYVTQNHDSGIVLSNYILNEKKYNIKQLIEDYKKLYPNDDFREIDSLERKKLKIDQGKSFWDHQNIFSRKRIGALVTEFIWGTAHPWEDRFFNMREVMSIMGMPQDYFIKNLDENSKLSHIRKMGIKMSQNVPCTTARFIGENIKRILEHVKGETPISISTPYWNTYVSSDFIVQYHDAYKRNIIDRSEKDEQSNCLEFE